MQMLQTSGTCLITRTHVRIVTHFFTLSKLEEIQYINDVNATRTDVFEGADPLQVIFCEIYSSFSKNRAVKCHEMKHLILLQGIV